MRSTCRYENGNKVGNRINPNPDSPGLVEGNVRSTASPSDHL